MHGSRLRPYLLPVVAILIVLAVGVGSAIAAIPNNGTYYACLTKSTGVMEVINYPKVKCAKGTQLIKWSQQGPAGPQGVQGPKGDPGPADWNAIANKPAGFADGQVSWGEVAGIPAGFADAVDDGAFVSTVVTTFGPNAPWAPGGSVDVALFPGRNVDLDCYIIPTAGPATWTGPMQTAYLSSDLARQFTWQTPNGGWGQGKVRCRAYSQGIAPAALRQQLKNVKVTIKKGKTPR
jgi:hypothetical protein